jgi:GxxExxY protein
MSELLFKQESYEIIGACFEVYTEKGCGFTEPLYQECMEIELGLRGIPFQPQYELPQTYKGRPLKSKFKPDFICYEKIILEIKAVSKLADEHRAQVLNYLSATNHQLGLLVNFGHFPKIEYERIARSTKVFGDVSRVSRANSSEEIVL